MLRAPFVACVSYVTHVRGAAVAPQMHVNLQIPEHVTVSLRAGSINPESEVPVAFSLKEFLIQSLVDYPSETHSTVTQQT